MTNFVREKLFFGILFLVSFGYSSKSLAAEAYVSYSNGFYLVETSPAETTDKTVVVFKDGPNAGTKDTVLNQFIYFKERSEGKFKVGSPAYIYLKELRARVEIIAFSLEHFALVQATEGDVSRRLAVGLGQLLPVEGSFGGVAIGDEVSVLYQENKDAQVEILKLKVVSYTDNALIGVTGARPFTFGVSGILKFEGCSKSHYFCVGQNYYSSKFGSFLKLKAFSEDGETLGVSVGSNLQTQEFAEIESTWASTQAGTCISEICIGETYLNALKNYSEVKVEAIAKDSTLYISNKTRPSEIIKFKGGPFDLVKASEKQDSFKGIHLGQKVALIDRKEKRVYLRKLVGVSRDQYPIVDLLDENSEFGGDIALGEGCDTSKKKCIGQKFFINGMGSLGRIVGIQNDGRFVIEDVNNSENFWWDVDASSLHRAGCPGGICSENSFNYK